MITATDPLIIVVMFIALLAFLLISAFIEKVLEKVDEVNHNHDSQ